MLSSYPLNTNFYIFSCYRAGNKIKEGKCVTFWGLEEEYQCVAVVGLGKKCKGFCDIEVVDQDREAIRVAASGIIRLIRCF